MAVGRAPRAGHQWELSVPGPSAEAVRNWSSLFTDVEAWRPVIAGILREHGMGSALSVRADVPGSNAVFIANETLVVKVYWPEFPEDADTEAQVHELMERHGITWAPRLLVTGTALGELPWRYAVFERLPGVSLGRARDSMPRADLEAIAEQFGEMVTAMHGLPIPTAGPLARTASHWQGFVSGQIEGAVARHSAGLAAAPHLLQELRSYLRSAEDVAPPGEPAVILHCDLTADHLLVEERDGRWRVTGLIDFGDADVGHRDYEWVALHLDCFAGYAGLTARFLRHYGHSGADASFAWRMMAYSLLHRFAEAGLALDRLGGAGSVPSWADARRALWGPVAAYLAT